MFAEIFWSLTGASRVPLAPDLGFTHEPTFTLGHPLPFIIALGLPKVGGI